MPAEVGLMVAEATGAVQGTAMEISVSKFELLKELTATQGVVERKTTIPILSNFLFEAANDRLTITATDLDLSLRTSCAAKVKREGACTIPARKLYDYVSCCPTPISPSSCWRTTGSIFAPAAPIPRWLAWRAPTSRDCQRFRQRER
jgi:hypothetical protein